MSASEWKLAKSRRRAPRGCVFFKPVAACGADHGVVKVDERQLFFGQWPANNNMCSSDKRPHALTQVAVVRD